MLAAPAMAVELFRYRRAAKDGGNFDFKLNSHGIVLQIVP
jgi:hypothetical protein